MKQPSHSPFSQIIATCGLFALVHLLPQPASAAVSYFQGFDVSGDTPSTTGLAISTTGTFGGTSANPTSQLTVITKVDDTNFTLTYDLIQIYIPSFTTSNTVNFTVGLGETASVTTEITYDPITIVASASSQALALTATTGGNFTIASFVSGIFSSLALSGHYTVTGPTQSASGNFLTSSLSPAGSVNGFRWTTYNSTGYPDTGTLTGAAPIAPVSAKTRWGSYGSIIDTTIDGAHVTASIDTAILQTTGFGNVNLVSIVPEPTAAALLGLGALFLGSRRRRR